MKFKGSPEFEEFWSFLESESPRGLVIVVAAHFDEKLGLLLGGGRSDFHSRIDLALARRLVSNDEHHDLHEIRKMRNDFAHKLRTGDFESKQANVVNGLKTWQTAVGNIPKYAELFPDTKNRLLYVAGCFFVRLAKRTTPTISGLPEPPFTDTDSWLIVTG